MAFEKKRKLLFKTKEQKSIEQLNKEIVEQRQRIANEENLSKQIQEKNRLSKQLFQLKNRKLIGAGAKAKKLSKNFGKAILKVGKKATPVIQKQARLIRDQQLRDEKIDKIRSKSKLKHSKKSKRTSKKTSSDTRLFQPLDF